MRHLDSLNEAFNEALGTDALEEFAHDEARLEHCRREARRANGWVRRGLVGWIDFFDAHALEGRKPSSACAIEEELSERRRSWIAADGEDLEALERQLVAPTIDWIRVHDEDARRHGFRDHRARKIAARDRVRPDAIAEALDRIDLATRDAYFEARAVTVREKAPDADQAPFSEWASVLDRLGLDLAGAELSFEPREDRSSSGSFAIVRAPYRTKERVTARLQISLPAQPTPRALFHELGHAAHIANVDMPAPCFAQEGAPTSAVLLETCALLFEGLREPADLFKLRQRLMVARVEAALSSIAAEQLPPRAILERVHRVEASVLGEPSARPVLTMPHLTDSNSGGMTHAYALGQAIASSILAAFRAAHGELLCRPVGTALRSMFSVGNRITTQELLSRIDLSRLTKEAS